MPFKAKLCTGINLRRVSVASCPETHCNLQHLLAVGKRSPQPSHIEGFLFVAPCKSFREEVFTSTSAKITSSFPSCPDGTQRPGGH